MPKDMDGPSKPSLTEWPQLMIDALRSRTNIRHKQGLQASLNQQNPWCNFYKKDSFAFLEVKYLVIL